jgi:RNA polymerase sigma factor (sigma-70 family)
MVRSAKRFAGRRWLVVGTGAVAGQRGRAARRFSTVDRKTAQPADDSGHVIWAEDEQATGVVAALFDEHHLELVRLALVMVGDLATAEGVAQDTFERLHQRRHRLSDEGDGLLGYARSAVLNRCRSLHRRALVARRHAPALAGPVAASPDSSAQAAERDVLMAALRSLPRRQREVLVLRYYADLDVGEVAQMLRIGPSTVRSATARGSAPDRR